MRAIRPFILLTLCLPLLMGAEVYRWVDANGVVNYSQIKPRGVNAQQLQTQGGGPTRVTDTEETPAAEVAAEPDQELSPEQQRMLEELEAEEEARQQDVAEAMQANCLKAQQLLQQLNSRGRVKVEDSSGAQRILPEEERQERIRAAQQDIVTNCVS